jgi:hypothetical protein
VGIVGDLPGGGQGDRLEVPWATAGLSPGRTNACTGGRQRTGGSMHLSFLGPPGGSPGGILRRVGQGIPREIFQGIPWVPDVSPDVSPGVSLWVPRGVPPEVARSHLGPRGVTPGDRERLKARSGAERLKGHLEQPVTVEQDTRGHPPRGQTITKHSKTNNHQIS